MNHRNKQTKTNDMTTKENNVATTISVELFSRMVSNIEVKMTSNTFKHELKYNNSKVNEVLHNNYKDIVNVLQSTVDKFYLGNYEISGFQNFTLVDFDYCLNHNLGLIKNCKKLLKFVS